MQIEAWILSLAAEHKATQLCSQLARVKSVSDSKQSSQAPASQVLLLPIFECLTGRPSVSHRLHFQAAGWEEGGGTLGASEKIASRFTFFLTVTCDVLYSMSPLEFTTVGWCT